MSRYTGPKVKKMRALGTYMSGLTSKSMEERSSRPGQHGQRIRRKLSDYAVQLREKQKVQYNYGLREKQLSRLVKEARKSEIAAGEKLLQLIERRLDNVVFRSGFARSIPAARQLVSHGHIEVNKRRVDIASYRVDVGDVVGLRDRSRNLEVIRDATTSARLKRPDCIECNYSDGCAKMVGLPGLDSASVEVDVARVIEFYAKRG